MTYSLVKAANLACLKIYDPIDSSSFDVIYREESTTVGILRDGDITYITFQGTENLAGWLEDIDIAPTYHPILGNVHTGFYANLDGILKQIKPDISIGDQIVVCGHSKGAGEAVLFAAILKIAGYDVVEVLLFACPNAGYQRFAEWMQENLPGISYRNGIDPVPEVPISPFVPPYPHIALYQPPTGIDEINPVDWHQGQLYVSAINSLKSA